MPPLERLSVRAITHREHKYSKDFCKQLLTLHNTSTFFLFKTISVILFISSDFHAQIGLKILKVIKLHTRNRQ